ncbi:hypothetical protein OKW21_003492 [Catalinimonas alkaloidigena]|uniref:hypothetical protein n=1 Tax=Catalinimonas alkaloidigena TaxID=1075417 RepID=UPI0024051E3B|nr:hypothetical protein [Catalinimonas alkaloidigena]MDF9798229.1 hypothetical protein [Catalinimonas alkaloidigena]
MEESNIKGVVAQLKEDIDQVSRQTKGLKNGERFRSVKKLNDLRTILDKITEINQSVDHLIDEQHQKRNGHH